MFSSRHDDDDDLDLVSKEVTLTIPHAKSQHECIIFFVSLAQSRRLSGTFDEAAQVPTHHGLADDQVGLRLETWQRRIVTSNATCKPLGELRQRKEASVVLRTD